MGKKDPIKELSRIADESGDPQLSEKDFVEAVEDEVKKKDLLISELQKENYFLKKEIHRLKMEIQRLKAELNSKICPNCGTPCV